MSDSLSGAQSEHAKINQDVRTRVADIIRDLVKDFIYYDRQGDDEFPVESIERFIHDGVFSIEELTDEFQRWLRDMCSSCELRS